MLGVFKTYRNSRMPYFAVTELHLFTELMCLSECVRMQDCYSVNYIYDDKICETGSYYDSRNMSALAVGYNGIYHYSFF